MSEVITNRDVAELLDALGQPENAATVRHFEGATPPVSWTTEIDALTFERDALRDTLEALEALLCKRCTTKWGQDNTL